METEHYFTLMLGIVNLVTGEVTMCQAGHPHPVVQRANGTIEQDGPGGFPVGLLAGVDFEQFTLQLCTGDRLLIVSDGVTECPDPVGQLLDEEGLMKMLKHLHDVNGLALLDRVVQEMTDYVGKPDFPDDVSAVLFEYKGSDQPI